MSIRVQGEWMDSPMNALPGGAVAPAVGAKAPDEPIAIIGIGCRFPGGANDPDSFWNILAEGVDAVTEVPADRWNPRSFYDPDPSKPGKTLARWGGFLADIEQFDPHFFGISPREAARMDVQQRLLLETAWEALEDGGQVLQRLPGRNAAVFVGISSWDYSLQQLSFLDRGVINGYSNTGGSLSIAANRISYCFDLTGPSVAVDTACSSALVAVHLACQSIWVDKCPLALAGGVNALLMPDWYVGFSRLGMLSPDGRCRAFDARANGFVRGEGAGMVVLKPLTRALAEGDRIYAVIRGTAVNQDGRTAGMTVPSEEAQEALLRLACHNAGVSPARIQFVETHGTGTRVGDPIEASALGRVLGAGRSPEQACLIGSVKTNIGHLEAGAGIAGLIKVALALHHRRIPGNLHFTQANPDIDFDSLRLRVPVSSEPWPLSEGPALAGVNSFGFGGTNAHVVVQEAPGTNPKSEIRNPKSEIRNPKQIQESTEENSTPAGPAGSDLGFRISDLAQLVPLSARSPEALRAAADVLRRFIGSCPADVSLHDIACNAALRRTHHDLRLAVVAHSKAELAEQLAAFAAGNSLPGTSSSRALDLPPRLAFVCSGQGPQWWAMGRQLLAHEPVFCEVIERCDEIVRRLGHWSLLDELSADEAHSRMDETAISQPSIFALQVALAALWRSWSVKPEAVVGHSVGEVAAAYLAGVFNLDDAVRVIYQRGRCMERSSSSGRMLAAALTRDEAVCLIADYGEHGFGRPRFGRPGFGCPVALAAVNSPASVTLSGEPGPLEEIARLLEDRRVFCRFLKVQYAFHSAQMDPVRDELLASLNGIEPGPAKLPFFSTVTGRRIHGPELGPEYWWHNVRQTVRFAEGADRLVELGCNAVVELSPHPVLATAVAECCQYRHKKVTVLPSLRRHEDERTTLLGSLGVLQTLGYPIDWAGCLRVEPGGSPLRFVALPLYPWQRERCWYESDESRVTRVTAAVHPLLGKPTGGPEPSWENRLELRLFPFLGDHCIQRAPIVPATAYLEIALAATRECLGGTIEKGDGTSKITGPVPFFGAYQLEDVRFANPCFLSPDKALWMQTVYNPDASTVRIHSRPIEGKQEWTTHFSAVARVRQTSDDSKTTEVCFDRAAIQQRCPRQISREECHASFQKLGLQYGPLFQGIERVWQGNDESLGVVVLPEGLAKELDETLFHPALLDACFQVVIPANKESDETEGALYLPAEVEHVCLLRRPGRRLWSHARILERTARWCVADIDMYSDDGELVAQIHKLRSQRVAGAGAALDELLYAYRWRPWNGGVPNDPMDVVTANESNCQSPIADCHIHPSDIENQKSQIPGHWLLFADRGGVGQRLADQLRSNRETCTLVFAGPAFVCQGPDRYDIDPAHDADMLHLLRAVAAPTERGLRGIIHLWNLDTPSGEELSIAGLDAAQEAGLLSVLHLVQAWDKAGGEQVPRLFLVTRGAQSIGEKPEPTAVAQSLVIGLGRVIVSEYPRLRCRMVDLGPETAVADVDALCHELWLTDEEDEVALRGGERYVHRYEPADTAESSKTPEVCGPYRLTTTRPGTLDGLTLRAFCRQPPGPGQVEIEVLAAGLNFSDVMKALGIYPGLPDGAVTFGAECSGRLTAVGEGVAGLRVGDEVLAVAPFAFGSHATTRADFVALKPAQFSFEEAATLPIAYLTASYGLDHLAHLAAGESVLIHSASGGVGLAAVQVARRTGAKIFATAGTQEKRDYLRGLGIDNVMDSRSLAFAEEVLKRTAGRGVDAVLNSLAGEAIAKGLASLADYGRFLEIGKRDIYKNTRLGLRPFRKNLSFFAIDLDRMMSERPAIVGALLRQIVDEVLDNRLAALPQRVFSIADVVSAFRHMQQGKHIGKIVLSMREQPAAVARAEDGPLSFRDDASYLITGGLGGFGLAVARWMAERGARHLVLIGRRGIHSPEAQCAVGELEKLGAQVTVLKADVAKEADVAAVLAEIDRSLPALRGVIHAAMVLEDSLLLNLDRALMRRVLAPKVEGAWNLHRQTLNRPLDFFILFSSLSSVFGHAGQGNYAAANAFLDSLAHYRRARNLPGLTINWGYLGEVGYLAERQKLGEQLERKGVLSFTVRQALALLERALQRQWTQISVMRVDWSRWRGLGVTGQVSPRFAHLLKERAASADSGQPNALPTLAALRAGEPAERRRLLDVLMRDKLSRVLGTTPSRLDGEKPLLNLGLDSLMAVELRNWIEGELQVNLPIVELMRSPSLARLTDLLLEQLTQADGASAAPVGADLTSGERKNGDSTAMLQANPAELLDKIDELSGEQIDALLTTLLVDARPSGMGAGFPGNAGPLPFPEPHLGDPTP
jgi:acyl transferase domain-containing protein/aryl carrier-like protein